MADVAENGALKADSPWRTDTAGRSAVITYNKEAGKPVEVLTGANSYSLRADQVNVTDSNACGGGGGSTGPIAPGY
jgi:argininosuccinate synthase